MSDTTSTNAQTNEQPNAAPPNPHTPFPTVAAPAPMQVLLSWWFDINDENQDSLASADILEQLGLDHGPEQNELLPITN